MKPSPNLHLTYCTNVHRGETWEQTLDALNRHTLAVRDQVGPGKPFGIGLRLSAVAARELSEPATLLEFRRWLDHHDCYVFTINGFPYGTFHGARVKEQVFQPDWTKPERLEYTKLLFDLLTKLSSDGAEASVSTLPGSFKPFKLGSGEVAQVRRQIWECVEHVAWLGEKTGRDLHLGLEPEPLGLFENSLETARFFDELRAEHKNDPRLDRHLGLNYDTCHAALQFEEPEEVLQRMEANGIRISKIHVSSALALRLNASAREALRDFAEDVYLHQVIARESGGSLKRYMDLPLALAEAERRHFPEEEWRVHFHVPLHWQGTRIFQTTADHNLKLFAALADQPSRCSHFEIETYTWEVLPAELRQDSVVTQLAREFRWCLEHMKLHGLAS